MKKIISGKLYDTEKATLVGDHYYKHRADFDYVWEFLYRKKTGEYFLSGEGGPMTRYAVEVGDNHWGSGERIIPLSYQEAENWAEENMEADAFEKEFGAIIDDDSRTVLSVSISTAAAEKARREASRNGMSLSEYVESRL